MCHAGKSLQCGARSKICRTARDEDVSEPIATARDEDASELIASIARVTEGWTVDASEIDRMKTFSARTTTIARRAT